MTPLEEAATRSPTALVKSLLRYGAKASKDRELELAELVALHYAASSNIDGGGVPGGTVDDANSTVLCWKVESCGASAVWWGK